MREIFDGSDITDGSVPGGATTSRSISVEPLEAMLGGCPRSATFAEYEEVAIERNLLGKQSYEGRRRAFRGLTELYLMDPQRVLFRALRDLWFEDSSSSGLLAGLCAYARDSTFRASGSALFSLEPGEPISTDMIASTLNQKFPGIYNEASLQKLARNTSSSWSQTGHFTGRTRKVRALVDAAPSTLAYAMLLGHLQGLRGESLLTSEWVRFLDLNRQQAHELALAAAQRRYIEYKSGGSVTEVGFDHLLRDEARL